MEEKYAVLSMDVEDWYHLDYFSDSKTDKTKTMLDGFSYYTELLNRHNIKTTFFVLSDVADTAKEQILEAYKNGHEIACHGKSHKRPLTMSPEEFEKELGSAKEVLSNLIGKEVIGYRAPCYSIDNERYEILKKLGFKYSSSKMDIPGHPLYGTLNMEEYNQPIRGVYCKDGFTEFALTTRKFLGENIAISGGGWIRLLPWKIFMKPLIKGYLKESEVYTLYLHPFELSSHHLPGVKGVPLLTKIRARKGLGSERKRIEQLIGILEKKDYECCTFEEMLEILGRQGIFMG